MSIYGSYQADVFALCRVAGQSGAVSSNLRVVSCTRNGPGSYDVFLGQGGVDPGSSNVQITVIGSNARLASVVHVTDTQVAVFIGGAELVDADFYLQVTRVRSTP